MGSIYDAARHLEQTKLLEDSKAELQRMNSLLEAILQKVEQVKERLTNG